jgi:hypothetical protein
LDIKERVANHEFRTQREMAEVYGVSETMIGKYREKGIALGLWTQEWWDRMMRLGKAARTRGTRMAPANMYEDKDDGSPEEASPF